MDDGVELLGFLQHLDGEAVRQVELADHDFDIDAEIVFVAEDFDDTAARIAGGGRPVSDFDFDDHAFEVSEVVTGGFRAEDAISGLFAGRFLSLRSRLNEWWVEWITRIPPSRQIRARRMGHPFFLVLFLATGPLQAVGDHDLLSDLLVDGSHVIVSRAVMEGANHGGITAGEHAQDAAFGAAVVLLAAEFYQHLVAVHGRAYGVRRNEDIAFQGAALGGVRNDEAVAVAMHAEAAGDEVLAGGRVLG